MNDDIETLLVIFIIILLVAVPSLVSFAIGYSQGYWDARGESEDTKDK